MGNKDRKIVVTGSTGLVGSHLVAGLINSGYHEITLPVRKNTSTDNLYKTLERENADLSNALLNIVETSLSNPIELAEVFAAAHTVFHCAAMVSLGGADEGKMVATNVEITQHIVDAALKAGVKTLIHTSSIAALGKPQNGSDYTDETAIIESLNGESLYAISKFLSENEIMRGQYMGLRTIIVNPATILGSAERGSGSSTIIPLLSKGIPFYTEGITAWVDVRDVVRAMLLLSESEKISGEKFVLAADNITFRKLITIANAATGHRPPCIKIGRKRMSLARVINEILAFLIGRKTQLSKELIRLLLNKNYYDGGKIKKTLNFDYTPLNETITRVVKEYISNKNG